MAVFLAVIPRAEVLLIEFLLPWVSSFCINGTSISFYHLSRFVLPYCWLHLCVVGRLIYRGRVREVLVSGGTRPILSVCGAAAAASIFRRVVVQHVLSLLLASASVSDLDLSHFSSLCSLFTSTYIGCSACVYYDSMCRYFEIVW